MASNPDETASSNENTPYLRALTSINLHIEAISAAEGKLYDLLYAGMGNKPLIQAKLNQLVQKYNGKQDELAALRLQAMVSTGPSKQQIAALRQSVSSLEQMNAVAAGLDGIMNAMLNITEAVLYSPKAAATRTARMVRAGSRASEQLPATSMIASAAVGAVIALLAMGLARGAGGGRG